MSLDPSSDQRTGEMMRNQVHVAEVHSQAVFAADSQLFGEGCKLRILGNK